MPAPKIKLLYYKSLIDERLLAFFDEFGDSCFAKSQSGAYSFTGSWTKFGKWLAGATADRLKSLASPFDIQSPEYMFVIGGCDPRDNMLLDHRNGYFPKKLDRYLKSEQCLKYLLKEKDVVFDMSMFQAASDSFFDVLFARGGAAALGPGYQNVVAIRHRRLDCYAVFKSLKYIYGADACVNVWKESLSGERPCLTATNDLICKYVNCKTEMNRSPEFKKAVAELRQYAD
jgi:hypothetical protein